MTDQHRQALLDSSTSYVEAKLSFADAILAARLADVMTRRSRTSPVSPCR
jgi:hypothetical protein